jgi:hypothetical protein
MYLATGTRSTTPRLLLGLILIALPALANYTTTYTLSNGAGLSAAGYFDYDGSTLKIGMINTAGSPAANNAQLLTGMLWTSSTNLNLANSAYGASAVTQTFNASFLPTGTSSAIIGTCSVAGNTCGTLGTNIIGEQAYRYASGGLTPSGASWVWDNGLGNSNITNVFGASNSFGFPGVSNLDGPNNVDGPGFGITPAGQATFPNFPVVRNGVLFTFTNINLGVANQAQFAALFQNIAFFYGTSLTEPRLCVGCLNEVPEPQFYGLLAMGMGGLFFFARRRRPEQQQ